MVKKSLIACLCVFTVGQASLSHEQTKRVVLNSLTYDQPHSAAQISFYAADLPTQYRIVVEGITNDGRIVHGEKLVTVEE